jgi:hypothetical protein
MKLIEKFMRGKILNRFFKISLTSIENEVAEDSIKLKYLPCIIEGIFKGLLILPAMLFLDMTVIISVLIPVTLVAGTAWFSISLANIKKKFENFGMELTIDIFKSFANSLVILILLASVSLLDFALEPLIESLIKLTKHVFYLKLISAILGIYVVSDNIYKIFLGALKFDINDAMLAGQNEAAEKFFKKSLSFLNTTSKNLQSGKGLQVANYYIGLSFFEIFTYINTLKLPKADKYIDMSNKLIFNPSMSQEKADKISIELIETFLSLIKNKKDENVLKSYDAICDELSNLKDKTKNEEQEMVDTRLSIVFQEISNMIDNSGETLFK